jgi:hypothetical protein
MLFVFQTGGKFATTPAQANKSKGNLVVIGCNEVLGDEKAMSIARDLANQSTVCNYVLTPSVLFDAVMKKSLVFDGYQLEEGEDGGGSNSKRKGTASSSSSSKNKKKK